MSKIFSKGDSKTAEKGYQTLEDFGDKIPKDAEVKINQVKVQGFVITPTNIVEVVVILMFYERQKKAFNVLQTRMLTVLNSLRQHERDSFYLIICRLALVQTQGHMLSKLELSNLLLQRGYGCLKDLNLLGLLDERTEHQPLEYDDSANNSYAFVHIHVQHFLAAIYLLKSPLMEVFQFLKNYTLTEHNPHVISNSSMVLRFFFGLAGSMFGDNSTALLQNVLKFLTQHINREATVADSRVSVLILCCLYEAQTRAESTTYSSLYRQVQNETFVRQIFSYDAQVIEENVEPFAYYLANTTDSKQSAWTIYCSNKQKVTALSKKLSELKTNVNLKQSTKLTASDSRRVVISNKNYDYLVSALVDSVALDSPSVSLSQGRRESSSSIASSYPESSMLCLSTVSVDTQYTYPSSANTSDCLAGPYGYLTKEQFESEKKSHNTFYFNMVKDFVTPNLQMHSATLVRAQYRKNDHVWFSFPPAMRHNFYENVQFTPVIPMHWVKVPQPDGSTELEEKFREKAISQLGAAVPTSNEVAELVVLNSHRVERITITPPSGGDPVLISLYRNSELSDNGEIGCDYLMQYHQVQEEVKWKKTNNFGIGKDEQIGRELPLPSKKGTESAEITTSTAMANLKETAGISAQQQSQMPSTKPGPREQILGSTKLFTRPLGKGQIHVSEQQQWAIEGFDRHCNQVNGQIDHGYRHIALPEPEHLNKLCSYMIKCDEILRRRMKRKRQKTESEQFFNYPIVRRKRQKTESEQFFNYPIVRRKRQKTESEQFFNYPIVRRKRQKTESEQLFNYMYPVARRKKQKTESEQLFNYPRKRQQTESEQVHVFNYPIVRRSGQKTESEQFHSKKSRSSLPSYKISQHGIHGYALVFNIINFTDGKRRDGAEHDTKKVVRLMADLKYKLFESKVHVDCTAEKIKRLMREAMSIEHSCHDSFILIIMSHGKDGYISGADNKQVSVEELFQEMRKCSSLVGKPKISIIQGCRLVVDDEFAKINPKACDEVIGYSTIPNAKAYRQSTHGSIYITEVCEAFESYPDNDILAILTAANDNIRQKYSQLQVPMIQSTLTKKFCLKY